MFVPLILTAIVAISGTFSQNEQYYQWQLALGLVAFSLFTSYGVMRKYGIFAATAFFWTMLSCGIYYVSTKIPIDFGPQSNMFIRWSAANAIIFFVMPIACFIGLGHNNNNLIRRTIGIFWNVAH